MGKSEQAPKVGGRVGMPMLDMPSFIFPLNLWHTLRIKDKEVFSMAFLGLWRLPLKKVPHTSQNKLTKTPVLMFVIWVYMHVCAHMCASSSRNLEVLR